MPHDPATCQDCLDIEAMRAMNAQRRRPPERQSAVPLALRLSLALLVVAILAGLFQIVTGHPVIDCVPVAVYQAAC